MKNHNTFIWYFVSAMAVILVAVLFALFDFGVNYHLTDEDTLVLVHAIFRHGERTVDPSTLYPNDPYINEKYYPYGVGQLTNDGKRREYNIGKALRRRYGQFLGEIYEPDILDAQSTAFNRTKMSLELVLAGLFPPVGDQMFEPALNWQPIPYNYLPRDQDKILLGVFCPKYKELYTKFIKSPRLQREYSDKRKLFQYLSKHSGWNITNYNDIFFLYFGLRSEKEWGFDLPNWTNLVFPQPLENLVIKEYYIATGNIHLRRLAVGYHLRKILEDTKAKIMGSLKPQNRKIFLYSGHETNIASFLATLDIFEPHIPPYGCYILIEVHKINEVYGIKLFYEDYTENSPRLLTLPGCKEFCPLAKFIGLVRPYLPSEDLCGQK